MKKRHFILALVVVGLFHGGCSTQKDRWINREYHALNTKFNVLFNGEEALRIGQAILLQNYQDDFQTFIPVEPLALPGENLQSSASIPSFALAEEKAVKAIQKHSMNIGGKQRNTQIQAAYMLLGKARYYDRRYFPALEAFNFLMESAKGQAAYNEAKLWREKTNLRLGNTAIALESLQVLDERLPEDHPLSADLHATLTKAFVRSQQLDSALVHIDHAALLEKKKDRKARYNYIKAQLYEKSNRPEAAKQAYDAIVALNRKAPRIFWMQAKLQSARLEAQQNNHSPMEALDRLAKAYENQAYLHLIRQAQARYLNDQDQDSLAVVYYNKSLKSPVNTPAIKAANFRELANLYFDQGNYLFSGNYLDSLLTQLPDGNEKKRTQRQRRGLDDVIALETTIKTTDSILRLTQMTPEQQIDYLTEQIETKRQKELDAIAEEKKSLFNRKNKTASNFYFYNERLLIAGRQAFLSTWGNRPNTDGWNRLSNLNKQLTDFSTTPEEAQSTGGFFVETPEYLAQQIPTDAAIIDSLTDKRRQARLDVGILYKERFNDPLQAEERLIAVLTDQPTPLQEATALYHCIQLFDVSYPQQAWAFRQRLLSTYADSPFAHIIRDPESYALSAGETPEGKYQALYQAYVNQEYKEVIEKAEPLKIVTSGTPLRPKIALLMAQTQGKIYGEKALVESLNELIDYYPNAAEAVYAKNLIDRLSKPPAENTQEQYKWVFVFPYDLPLDSLSLHMEKKGKEILNRPIKVSRDVYNLQHQFIVVHAQQPFQQKKKLLAGWQEIPTFLKNTNNFVVLGSNYGLIQRQKSWKSEHDEKQ